MHKQQVTANFGDKQYVWTDDSKQSLEDWKKARGDEYTFSELKDNPELAKRTSLKKNLNDLDSSDPAVAHLATKKLIRYILKDLAE